MNTKEHNSDVATCRCCLLAETMRGCKACRFNVGLKSEQIGIRLPKASRYIVSRSWVERHLNSLRDMDILGGTVEVTG